MVGVYVYNGRMILWVSAIALVFVILRPCGGDEVDCDDRFDLSGDPERGIVAGAFATVGIGSVLSGFQSDFDDSSCF